MAFYDWNGNGRMDSFDSFMDYNICMGEDKNSAVKKTSIKTHISIDQAKSTEQKPVPISKEERRARTRTSSLRFLALFLLCLVISCFNETLASMVMIGYALIKIFYYQHESKIP